MHKKLLTERLTLENKHAKAVFPQVFPALGQGLAKMED